MAEYAPVRRRGYYSALSFVGIMIGTIIASLVFVGLGQVPQEALLGWSCRPRVFPRPAGCAPSRGSWGLRRESCVSS